MLCDSKTGSQAGGGAGRSREEVGGGSRTCSGRSQPGRVEVQPEGVGGGGGAVHHCLRLNSGSEDLMNILQDPHYEPMQLLCFFP